MSTALLDLKAALDEVLAVIDARNQGSVLVLRRATLALLTLENRQHELPDELNSKFSNLLARLREMLGFNIPKRDLRRSSVFMWHYSKPFSCRIARRSIRRGTHMYRFLRLWPVITKRLIWMDHIWDTVYDYLVRPAEGTSKEMDRRWEQVFRRA